MERFWSNSRNIRQLIATGYEPFPGEMLNPQSEIVLSKKMLDLMVEYYLASYENFSLVDVESVRRCLVRPCHLVM